MGGPARGIHRYEPLTVVGSFAVLRNREDLARFVVDGTVLDTNLFRGRRCPSEQTALSLYRIARRHGWDDVSRDLVDWTAGRVGHALGNLPVHDLLGQGETHTRFLGDAALLLEADGHPTAKKAHAALERLAAPGPWYRHDTLEAASGQNHLVLNTHVHTLVARAASGLDIDAGVAELDRVLSLPADGWRARAQAALIGVSDVLRAAPSSWVRERGWRLGDIAHHSAARSRVRRAHLALPGGWLARDVLPLPTPSYLTVNLNDLAVLARLRPTPVLRRAVDSGVRWARATGFFRAQRIAGDPLAVLVPVLLRNAGYVAAAQRAAGALRRAAYAPCIGWPGYTDRLWERLPEGTP